MSKQPNIIAIVDEADTAYQAIRHLINVMRAKEELPEAEVAFDFVEHIDASPILMKMALLLDQTQAATYQLLNILNDGVDMHLAHDPAIALYDGEQRARIAFEASDATNNKENHNRLERKFLKASEDFITTPATSLEGLLLQANYLEQRHEIDEVRVLVSGIRNLMKGSSKPERGQPTVNDPVIVHGHELAKLRAEEAAFDEKRQENDAVAAAHSQHLYDKAIALEDLIATMKATSIEGALVQVLLVFNQLNNLDTFKHDEDDIRKMFRTCSRLLYSIRDVLKLASAVKPLEFAVEHYMGDIQNPWLDAEERKGVAQAMTQPRAA